MRHDLFRIYAPNASTATRENTDSEEEFDFIEQAIEETKLKAVEGDWPEPLKAPFRYALPVGLPYQKRFLPPGWHRNAIYGALAPVTGMYETAYHFMSERVHFNSSHVDTPRGLIKCCFKDDNIFDIRNHPHA